MGLPMHQQLAAGAPAAMAQALACWHRGHRAAVVFVLVGVAGKEGIAGGV